MSDFVKDLENLINRYSLENGSNTPDFILAEYLRDCLNVFNKAVKMRANWWGNENTTPETTLELYREVKKKI